MAKRILTVFLVVGFILALGVPVFATSSEDENPAIDIQILTPDHIDNVQKIGTTVFSTPSNLTKIGNASISQVLTINNIAVPLYATFDDPGTALSNIKKDCVTILTIIAKTYQLAELSENNWKTYHDDMYLYLDRPDKESWYSEINSEFAELSSFFDIYGNSEKNEEIISSLVSTDAVSDLLSDESFILKFPHSYGYEISKYLTTISESSVDTTASFYPDLAVSYAEDYAVTPNPAFDTCTVVYGILTIE